MSTDRLLSHDRGCPDRTHAGGSSWTPSSRWCPGTGFRDRRTSRSAERCGPATTWSRRGRFGAKSPCCCVQERECADGGRRFGSWSRCSHGTPVNGSTPGQCTGHGHGPHGHRRGPGDRDLAYAPGRPGLDRVGLVLAAGEYRASAVYGLRFAMAVPTGSVCVRSPVPSRLERPDQRRRTRWQARMLTARYVTTRAQPKILLVCGASGAVADSDLLVTRIATSVDGIRPIVGRAIWAGQVARRAGCSS